ncbi:hypothetical protein TNCV_4057611 [Trichonephila clavipes]|nr:hypothetical protein TNCV_4057611 [Trichonephila clavipes]
MSSCGQERGLLHSDQVQSTLDRSIIEKTITSYAHIVPTVSLSAIHTKATPSLRASLSVHTIARLASWTAYKFGQTRGMFTATVEREILQDIIWNTSVPNRITVYVHARGDPTGY